HRRVAILAMGCWNSCVQFFNQVQHLTQCLAAVADTVFDVGWQFGTGFASLCIEKKRVIAEAASAARGVEDFAAPVALSDQRLWILRVAYQHHGAIVM